MFFDIFRIKARRERQKLDLAIYTKLVQQARQPSLYTDYGVPDTFDGRYEMVVLHVFLLCYRLKASQSPEKECTQRIFDLMVCDIDSVLREMGVGDLSVGKKIKPMIEIFYGRTASYDTALTHENLAPLAEALQRNIYAHTACDRNEALQLALYVRENIKHLVHFSDKSIVQGDFNFVLPEITAQMPASLEGNA